MEPVPLPISGDHLLEQELEAIEKLRQHEIFCTGCSDIDNYLLGGGFESGTVVGVSAEDEEFGLTLGLQTVARSLLKPHGLSKAGLKVLIVTTLTTNILLPALRNVFRAQAASAHGGAMNDMSFLRKALEDIKISRVFDIQGLWEVLREIEWETRPPVLVPNESTPSTEATGLMEEKVETTRDQRIVELTTSPEERTAGSVQHNQRITASSSTSKLTEYPLPPLRPQPTPRTPPRRITKAVIEDSEEEEAFSPVTSPILRLRSPSIPSSLSPPPSQSPVAPEGFDISPLTRARAHNPMMESFQAISTIPDPNTPIPSRPRRLGSTMIQENHLETSRSASPAVQANSQRQSRLEPPPEVLPSTQTHPQVQTATPDPPTLPPSTTPKSLPSILLVTHLSSLLSSHFTSHNANRVLAHREIDDLSLRLHQLARRGVFVMLLNNTASPYIKNLSSVSSNPVSRTSGLLGRDILIPAAIPGLGLPRVLPRDEITPWKREDVPPLVDQTLTSIFSSFSMEGVDQKNTLASPAAMGGKKKNKPAYGAVFSRLLDIHLLCTRVPRTPQDVRILRTPVRMRESGGGGARFAWVVEVLLDDVGVLGVGSEGNGVKNIAEDSKDGEGELGWREERGQWWKRCREQRWAAVDVIGGKVMDVV